MKDVTIKTEFITLGQLLKFLGLVGSGGEAKMFLQMNKILVNDAPDNRRGRKIYPNDIVKIEKDEYLIKTKWS